MPTTGHAQEVPSRTLLLAGDVMLGNWVTDHMDRDGLDYPFRAVQHLLEKSDLHFFNLENPIGTPDTLDRENKTYTFAMPSRYLNALRYSQVDIVSLANNHILDYGRILADSTTEYLQSLNIRTVGYGAEAFAASSPEIIPGTVRVGFLGYSMTFPRSFWATDTSAGTAYPTEEYFTSQISLADSLADFTVVSFHWGGENSDSTKQYQQVYARRAIDAGADLIMGHHPHVWQGLEVYKNRVIAYSLGNYCFGSFSPSALKSGMLEIEAGKDTIYRVQIHPLNVKNVDVRFQPQPMSPAAADSFYTELQTISARFDSTSALQIGNNGLLHWD